MPWLTHAGSRTLHARVGTTTGTHYAALARELGLDVAQTGKIGWSDTTVPETTALDYAQELAQLAGALVIHRRADNALTATGGNDNGDQEGHLPGEKPGTRNSIPCICACPRRIRVAASVLALGPITCGNCNTQFGPVS